MAVSDELRMQSSRESSRSPDPPQPAFLFVSTTDHEAATGRVSESNTSQIRAHVTKLQHAKQRSDLCIHAESWVPYNLSSLDKTSTQRNGSRRPLHIPLRRDASSASTSTSTTVSSSASTSTSTPEPSSLYDTPSVIEDEAADDKESSQEYCTALIDIPTPDQPIGTSNSELIWTHPTDWDSSSSPILSYDVHNFAVDIFVSDLSGGSSVIQRRFCTLCKTDTARMSAVLLTAAAHRCLTDPSHVSPIDLLALKARALREIIEAIASPDRAITDSTIAAVAELAAYEAIFGCPEILTKHIKGLLQMVKLRGGFEKLELDGLLERRILWIEENSCHR